jgi:hypothetical protein
MKTRNNKDGDYDMGDQPLFGEIHPSSYWGGRVVISASLEYR